MARSVYMAGAAAMAYVIKAIVEKYDLPEEEAFEFATLKFTEKMEQMREEDGLPKA